MNKAKINDKIYEVAPSIEEYYKNKIMYDEELSAIQSNDTIYPLKKGTNYNEPGLYIDKNSCINRFVEPNRSEIDKYSSNNLIDFRSNNMKELIEKSEKLKNIEKEILINPDNIFVPKVLETDEPEMKALKIAVCEKNIDLDKYESRFGANYQNDRRLFNRSSITLTKLKTIANALDIKVSLTLEDKHENVPNPIGRTINVDLNSQNCE